MGAWDQAISVIKTIEEVNRAHSVTGGPPCLGNAQPKAYLATAEGFTGKARMYPWRYFLHINSYLEIGLSLFHLHP
jgi:hypothetical protein